MKEPKLKTSGAILMVPAEKIHVNPLRARIYYNEQGMGRLMRSILSFGLVEPLCVVAAPGGKYVLVSGERRYRAALRLGMGFLPCVLLPGGGENALYAMLSNALTAAPLSFFEVALCFQKLHDRFEIPYEEIASRLGIEVGEVYSRLRLLEIPPTLRRKMVEDGLSESYVRLFLPLADGDKARLLEEVERDHLSLYEAKARAKAYLAPERGGEVRVVTFYKDSRVFRNTIESAVERCRAVGIAADINKSEDEQTVEYKIRIGK